MAYLGNTIVSGSLRVTNGIYGNGSGLTTLNASNISSGTLNAARLATSGATAGSYGPSAAVSGTNGTTMNVPYITVDTYGRVTAISNKVYTSKDTVYTHPTTSGNKHIPSGGSSGQILRWSADGTAAWGADNNTTYANFVKSGSGAKAGLVPAPSTTAGTTKYLREDCTWQVPPDNNTTYANFVKSGSGAKAGLVPAPSTTAGTTKYLREDCTWQVPPDTNTVYTHPTTAGNKHVPSGGASNQVLVYSAAGTAAWSTWCIWATN